MKKQSAIWTTKDGKKVSLCDLEDSHLLNIAQMLVRYSVVRMNKEHKAFLQYPEPSGECAQDCYNMAIDQMSQETWEDYTPAIYTKICNEINRRRLEFNPSI